MSYTLLNPEVGQSKSLVFERGMYQSARKGTRNTAGRKARQKDRAKNLDTFLFGECGGRERSNKRWKNGGFHAEPGQGTGKASCAKSI